MEHTWKFELNLPQGLKKAAQETFCPVWHSAALNMRKVYNGHNLRNSGWYAGLKIGTVTAKDQGGEFRTWEVSLWESGSIMQSVEGASRWQLNISGV